MGVMMLAAGMGSEVEVETEGVDEAAGAGRHRRADRQPSSAKASRRAAARVGLTALARRLLRYIRSHEHPGLRACRFAWCGHRSRGAGGVEPRRCGALLRRSRRSRGARSAACARPATRSPPNSIALQRDLPADAPAELSALLDVHLMLLHDESLTGATKHWMRERHYNAEWALSAQLEVLARQFDEMEDDYLRERKADLEQVVERMLRALARDGAAAGAADRGPGAARLWRRGPAGAGRQRHRAGRHDAVQAQRVHRLRHRRRRRTSHTAIVARSMDIPAVVGAREASRLIRQDDWVVIDGDAGVVIVNPSPIVLEEYRFRQRQSELERARLNRLAPHPGGHARRRGGRAAGQHRTAGRRGRRAGGRRGGCRPVPQRVPVHEPRRRPAGRGRAVRGLP